jgi:hypothetical protein
VKLITEALLESGVHQIGPVPMPHIGTGLSLAIIGAVITTVIVTSVLATSRRARIRAEAAADPAEQPGQMRPCDTDRT